MKDGGPAFPVLHQNEITGYIPPETSGMTLRDYFAAKAMQGLMSRSWDGYAAEEMFKIWSVSAYAVADAMLKAREQ